MSDRPLQRIARSIHQAGTEGTLRRSLGTKKGETIPTEQLESLRARLRKIKNRTPAQSRKLKRVNLALTFRGAN